MVKLNGEIKAQTVSEHCRRTAEYTAESLAYVNMRCIGYLSGLLHDMGKCTQKFTDYITDSVEGAEVKRGSVNHTFAGVIFLFERFHPKAPDNTDRIKCLTCEIIAWAIASHHGIIDGVSPDCIGSGFKNEYKHRLDKDRDEIFYQEAVDNYLSQCAEIKELEQLFEKACGETEKMFDSIKNNAKIRSKIAGKEEKKKTQFFFLGMAARMVLSALVDGDRRDTAEFMQGKRHEFMTADREFWQRQEDCFERKYINNILNKASDTPINSVRKYISDSAAEFAECPDGIYRMTVGTGAGKTLSSLRFALRCAKIHRKKRIIFVIPLLSVLEQNASEIKEYLDDKNIVLEHHSNIVREADEDKTEQLDMYELLIEGWDSPVIITTLVQLLNTLFSGKTTAARRMRSLCESVIIIDEIQSLPRKLTYMFNLAMNFLSMYCGCTIVFSSATQPCFEKLRYPVFLSENSDMIKETSEMMAAFKRTNIINIKSGGGDGRDCGMSLDELKDFAMRVISECSSLLIICNTKRSASELFNQLKLTDHGGLKLYHLSTGMCMQHRRDALESINRELGVEGKSRGRSKVICVSTQLVEAGVDFSFESCIRIKAGLDNIAQAAGRCNRSGEFEKICNVYVASLKEEGLKMLPDIESSKNAYNEWLGIYSNDKNGEYGDILSAKSVELFYERLITSEEASSKFMYPLKINGLETSMIELLSDNYTYSKKEKLTLLNQAFKTAGNSFSVFDDNTTDVIVPYNDEAQEIIQELHSGRAEFDIKYFKRQLKRAKPYTISLFGYELNNDMLYSDKNKRFLALRREYYDENTGFKKDNTIIL